MTTHVALVARAFGARGIFIEGEDNQLLKSIYNVLDQWGGKSYFNIEFVSNPKTLVKSWKERGGKVVHLTMYGINIINKLSDFDQINSPLLVIVGSEKVEGWYYYNSDYNIAVGNQPHSEVSALAIFLDRIYKGEELNISFSDAKLTIIPKERGKKVVKNE
ncbi:tRNA methyltransferase [Stygiolobus caldivivus]|uniref:tRNA methyltransferase n=1 Tax=Stygiolobus caldivivus TaxID=2824673 RepID=UPI0030B7F6DE